MHVLLEQVLLYHLIENDHSHCRLNYLHGLPIVDF